MAKKIYYSCKYRKCGKPLSDKKKRRHAMYCDRKCRDAEDEAVKADDVAAKLKTEAEYFKAHLRNHPDFYKTMLKSAKLSLEMELPFSVRGYFYERRQHGLKINNRLSRWYARKLIFDYPFLADVIEVRGKDVGYEL